MEHRARAVGAGHQERSLGRSQRVAELVDADERAAGGGTGRRCGHDDGEQRTHHRRDEPIAPCHDRTPITGRKPSYCPPRSYGSLRRRSRSAAGTIPAAMPTIGATDLDVFPLCLGGNVFGWTADERAGIRRAGRLRGGRRQLPGHGRLVHAVGRGQLRRRVGDDHRPLDGGRGNRDRIVVATKVGKLPGAPRPRPRDHPRRSRRVARAGWAPTESTSTTRTRTTPTRRSSGRWRRSAS